MEQLHLKVAVIAPKRLFIAVANLPVAVVAHLGHGVRQCTFWRFVGRFGQGSRLIGHLFEKAVGIHRQRGCADQHAGQCP